MNNKENTELSSVEYNFWSIFRNKYLFTTIFNNFKFKSIKNYNDLIGTFKILNRYSNGIEIIIDKLSSNNFFIRNFEDIIHIFRFIRKDNERTRIVYRLLFQVYKPIIKSYQFENKSKLRNHTIKKYLLYIISTNNIFGLSQFIEYFSITKNELNEYENSIYELMHSNKYINIKLLNYLLLNQYIPKNFKKIPIPNINYLINKINFGQLIKLFNYLINIYYEKENENGLISEKINSLINELKEIKTIDFSKNYLKLSILDLFKYLISKSSSNEYEYIKSIIQKMYKVLYSFKLFTDNGKILKPREYYFYFKSKERIFAWLKDQKLDTYNLLLESNKDYAEIIFKNNNERFELLLDLLDKNSMTPHSSNIDFLFKTNDIKLIDTFLKKYPQYIESHKFSILQNIEKTEMLDYFFKEYHNQFFIDNSIYWLDFKNIKMLEHYEKLMKSVSKKFKIDNNAILYRNPEIIIRALENRSLMYEIDNSIFKPFSNLINENGNSFSNYSRILNYIGIKLKNKEDIIRVLSSFIFKENIIDSIIPSEDLYNSCNVLNWIFKYWPLESILKLLKENKDNLSNYRFSINYPKNQSEPQEQIILNHSDYNTITYTINNSNLIIYILYSGVYGIEEILKLIIEYPESFNDAIYLHIGLTPFKYFTSELFEKFIIICLENINENIINFLFLSIRISARKGFFSIFKKIISKYDYILKIKNNSNNSLFDEQSLKKIVEDAMDFCNCELATLLINYINFSDKIKKKLNKKNKNKNKINLR